MNKNGFDHIKLGKNLKYFVYPPATLPDMTGFEDDLKIVCIEKIKELLELAEEIKRLIIEQTRILAEESEDGSLEESVLAVLPAYNLKEYLVVRRWINYWTKVWRKICDKPLPEKIKAKINFIGYFELQMARKVPIESLYEGKLRQVGPNLIGLCPFHEERTPSFQIYPDGHYHCFGCHAHGNAISFIEKIKGLNFPETVKYLLSL